MTDRNQPHRDKVADELADRLARAEVKREQIEGLHEMEIFDTLFTQDGRPMVTRVPGGWIWCIFGQHGFGVSTCFVPYTDEGHPRNNKLAS